MKRIPKKSGLFMKYFVLRPSLKDDHGLASLSALETYMKETSDLRLAEDIRTWIAKIKAGL